MKYFLVGLLMLNTISAFALDCRSKYFSSLKTGIIERIRDDEGEELVAIGFVAIPAATFTAAMGIMGPLVFLSAGVGMVEGFVAIANMKERKMIKLINQAEEYSETNKHPGKLLKKLYSKTKDYSDMTLEQLAKSIADSNKDLSLCHDSRSFRQVVKDIKTTNRK